MTDRQTHRQTQGEKQYVSRPLHCSYTNYTCPPSRFIQHLKKLAQMGAGKSVPEFFVREKEKRTNKGTDKQYVNGSSKHSTTLISLTNCVPNFKILNQVVPEKSLTKKINRQTDIVTEKAKTINPYILRMPGV